MKKLLIILIGFVLAGCYDEPVKRETVLVELKARTSKGELQNFNIAYTSETGVVISVFGLDDPIHVSFKRTFKTDDILNFAVSGEGDGEILIEIYINGAFKQRTVVYGSDLVYGCLFYKYE